MGREEKVAEVVAASLIKPGIVESLVIELCSYEWQRLHNGDHTVPGDLVVQAVDEAFDNHGLHDVVDHKHVCRWVANMLGENNPYGKDADRRG